MDTTTGPAEATRTIARMGDERPRSEPDRASAAVAAAERLDDLADTADLMGDDGNATRMRHQARLLRDLALHELDRRDAPTAADE